MSRLTEITRGRWLAILPALGVRAEYLTGRHGPCPFCGGVDRWRFTNRNGDGVWICNQCGAGDGVELVKRFLKVDFREAMFAIENVLRLAPPSNEPKPRDNVALREECKQIWNRAARLADDAAVMYLRSRAIDLPSWPRALRCAPHVMLAKIVTSTDMAINLHRTFLPNGPKKFMPGVVPAGSAVRLMPHVGILGIAEGIETALSAYLLFGVPCWAGLHARGVETFTPPSDVRALCIFADNDKSATGQSVAWSAARRLRAKGLEVGVKMPEDDDADWNDVLRGRAK